MQSLRKFLASTSAREMVMLLNHGAAPDSRGVRALMATSGQVRQIIVILLGISICLVATFLFFAAAGHYYVGFRPGKALWFISAMETLMIWISALGVLLLSHGPLMYQTWERLVTHGCWHWSTPLQAHPERCKELLELTEKVGPHAVLAVGRPLYIADLAYARELFQQQERDRAAQEAAAAQAEKAQKDAEACARVHSLVRA